MASADTKPVTETDMAREIAEFIMDDIEDGGALGVARKTFVEVFALYRDLLTDDLHDGGDQAERIAVLEAMIARA